MMSALLALKNTVETELNEHITQATILLDELTVDVIPQSIHAVCLQLRDHPDFHFEQLIDLCGVDYAAYGQTEWSTEENTYSGFSRAVQNEPSGVTNWSKPRFGVIYHLLSLKHNHRIRLRTFLSEEDIRLDSVIDIWNVANFFEREAFDLYGILFEHHPDLRRVLTDYGFIGHPFRKDFPLIGQVEPRYDAALQRVVNEPVDIKERVLVPKVIRDDNRYLADNSTKTPEQPNE